MHVNQSTLSDTTPTRFLSSDGVGNRHISRESHRLRLFWPSLLINIHLEDSKLRSPHDEEPRVVHQAYCGGHHRSDLVLPVTHKQ
jgi:hypothetical protein